MFQPVGVISLVILLFSSYTHAFNKNLLSTINNPGHMGYLTTNGDTGQFLFVPSETGLYRSTDYGFTFAQVVVDASDTSMLSSVGTSFDGSIVYAVSNATGSSNTAAVYKSTTFGASGSFAKLDFSSDTLTATNWQLLVMSASGQVVCLSTLKSVACNSHYGAAGNWQETVILSTAGVVRMGMSPNGKYLVAASMGSQLYLNKNFGAAADWTIVPGSANGWKFVDIGNSGQYIIGLVNNADGESHRSTDYGASIGYFSGGNYNYYHGFCDANCEYFVMLAYGRFLYKLGGYGLTPTALVNDNDYYHSAALVNTSSTTMYFMTTDATGVGAAKIYNNLNPPTMSPTTRQPTVRPTAIPSISPTGATATSSGSFLKNKSFANPLLGMIVGVVIGSIVFLAVLVACLYCFLYSRQQPYKVAVAKRPSFKDDDLEIS